MTTVDQLHEDQLTYWNGPGGTHWVARYEHMDRMLLPVSDVLLARAGIAPGMTVLDIGCGCGGTVAAIAHLVGPTGKALGLDISRPMLEVAARRVGEYPHVTLICDDAAHRSFPPATVDVLVSRFGVMFFGDPEAAFANLRGALKPGARMTFACWRPINENPWMKLPLDAVAAHVAPGPRPDPDAPGPFAFSNRERVQQILTSAGFINVRITPRDLVLDLAAGLDLSEAVHQSIEMGPIRRALEGQPETTQRVAREAVARALQPYVTPTGVLLTAGIWVVEASTP